MMNITAALGAFAALGQETRLDVFRILVRAGGEGMAAGDIAAAVSVLPNTLSTHLQILGHAGLVSSKRAGRSVRYFADFAGMRDLLAFLMEDCCDGRPELCQPVIDAVACPH